MIIKSVVKPQDRIRYFTWLGAISQLSLVLGILMERLDIPSFDFWIGLLIGFSIVGNLAYLSTIARKKN